MNGEFILKTSKGDLALKLTKRVFYNYEKTRGQSFLTPFAKARDDGAIEISALEVANSDLQVELIFFAQTNTKYRREVILDISDPQSMTEFLTFAIQEYTEIRGLPTEESEKNE